VYQEASAPRFYTHCTPKYCHTSHTRHIPGSPCKVFHSLRSVKLAGSVNVAPAGLAFSLI
jgi:hypothetical protein